MKKLRLFIICVLFLTLLTGCNSNDGNKPSDNPPVVNPPQVEYCTVEFVSENDESKKVTIEKDSNYTLPNNTFNAPAGKIFKCWKIGETYKNPGDQIVVSANTTIYAEWEKVEIKYTISFDSNFGTGEMEPIRVDENAVFTLPNSSFTAPNGKKFESWKIDNDYFAPGREITITKDITVKAVWTDIIINQYTVMFLSNGGTGEMNDVTVNENDIYVLPICLFEAPAHMKFLNWEIDGEDITDNKITVTSDTVIVAKWEYITYEITFNANGGEGDDISSTINEGETFILPGNYFRAPEYKQFTSWNVDGIEKQIGDEIIISKALVIKANWEDKDDKVYYRITFDSNGGTGEMNSVEVGENLNYTLPQNGFTAGEGKKFKCWLVGTQVLTPGDKITINENLSVKAIWVDKIEVVNTYTISFVSNGGTGEMASVTKNENDTYTLPECGFTAPTGKAFKCYKVGQEEKNPNDEITINSNLIIIPIWKDIVYTISFDPNGGEGNVDPLTFNLNDEYPLPGNFFTAPASKQFKCWEVDGVEKQISDIITIKKDLTIKAIWEDLDDSILKCTISFDSNGGTGEMNSVEVSINSNYILPSNSFIAPTGKKFKSWEINSISKLQGEEIVVESNLEVKAIWEDTKYTITFVSNGGTGNMDSVDVVVNSTYKLPACSFTAPEKYYFKNWSISGEEKAVDDEITVTNNLYVYAYWVIIKHSISFNPNGGTGTINSVTINEGEKYSLPLGSSFTAPEGQRFKCWLVDDLELEQATQITIEKDLEVKAIWEDIKYTIRFLPNGGTGEMTGSSVYPNASYVLPTNEFEAPTGQRFKCWSVAWEIEVERHNPSDELIIVADTMIRPVWEDIPYVVTFKANGGLFSDNTTEKQIEKAKNTKLSTGEIPVPTKKYSQVEGWYKKDNTIWDFNDVLTGNIELHAEWKIYDYLRYTSITNSTEYAVAIRREIDEAIIPSSYNDLPVTEICGYTIINDVVSIEIPSSIKTITQSSFRAFPNLVDVYYDGTIEGWCNIDIGAEEDNPMYVADNFFILDENGNVTHNGKKYTKITNIVIPDTVTTIDQYQFSGLKQLTSITISNNVTSIGSSAFSYCENLEKVIIPDSVQFILIHVFKGCNKLESITIPFIGRNRANSIYNNQYALGYLFGTTEYEGSYAATQSYPYGDSTETYYIPNTLKEVTVTGDSYIPKTAFKDCISLESINISNDVLGFVDSNPFEGLTELKNLGLPKSLSLLDGLFSDLDNLENVYYSGTIEDWCNLTFTSITSTPMSKANNFYYLDQNGNVDYANNKYSLLTELTIPSSINSIGDYQFYGFGSLTKIDLGNNITSIGTNAFGNDNKLKEIIISKSVLEIDTDILVGASSLEKITIPFVGDKKTRDEDITKQYPFGYLFGETEYDGSYDAYYYKYSSDIGNITKHYYIPKTLNEVIIDNDDLIIINTASFMNCRSIKNLTLTKNISKVEANAFRETDIDTVYFNGDITDWCNIIMDGKYGPMRGAKSFYYLDETLNNEEALIHDNLKYRLLKNLVIDGTKVKTVHSNQFYNTYLLIDSVVMTSGVEIIEDDAFYIYIAKYYIPKTVTQIRGDAISSYNHNDFRIYYEGTESEFDNIYFDVEQASLKNSLKASTTFNVTNINNYMFVTENATNYLIDYLGLDYNLVLPENYNNETYKIKNSAFKSRKNIFMVDIPESVVEIEDNAFYECYDLIQVRIRNKDTVIGSYAFRYCQSLVEIYIPSELNYGGSLLSSYSKKIHYNQQEDSILIFKNSYIFMYVNDKGYFVKYVGQNDHLLLPESFTYQDNEITSYAIYNYAFAYHDYRYIKLASSTTEIETNAFIYMCHSIVGTVVINEGIEEAVGFYGASLFVLLPSTTTLIGSFNKSYIRRVYYTGTAEEWTLVTQDSCDIQNDVVYYYSEEEPTDAGQYWHFVNGEAVIWETA